MRYLNKIIFINSAKVKYAEIELDGNVHLIGTQGVGKSTLLRAILFFYNSDKTKLGISREKSNFDSFYFPNQNSYIVYEVIKDGVPYSILAFRKQGRVAFRFIDSAYDKNIFINEDGGAYESWEKIRPQLGVDISYTKSVSNYEDYRNILYGNNSSLSPEFRKYSIIESKQYQNIPRTIQNVFLNSKLDAEFIKQTIIKSLNENEVEIDLETYSRNHLKNFEAEINDIKIWTEKNRKGEIVIRKQADKVIDNHRSLKHLEFEMIKLAKQIGLSVKDIERKEPVIRTEKKREEERLLEIKKRMEEAEAIYNDKREGLKTEIGICKDKLKTIKNKEAYFNDLGINEIIERSSAEQSLIISKKQLKEQKELLTSKYSKMSQKYEDMKLLADNQLTEFRNQQKERINSLNEQLNKVREEINNRYSDLIDKIKSENSDSIDIARNMLEQEKDKVASIKHKRVELKHQRLFEKEIEACKAEALKLKEETIKLNSRIKEAKSIIENTQRQWEIEDRSLKHESDVKIQELKDKKADVDKQIEEIESIIKRREGSFYSWLNNNLPEWNDTIGKVVDEKDVLFNTDLNPVLVEEGEKNLYGVNIDLSQLDKSVKTIEEYREDLNGLVLNSKELDKEINQELKNKDEELKKLARKFQNIISENKEIITVKELELSKNNHKIDENDVKIVDLERKAIEERDSSLQDIDKELDAAINEKVKAEKNIEDIKKSIEGEIDAKKKERDETIAKEQESTKEKVDNINDEIKKKEEETKSNKEDISKKQNEELKEEGADVEVIENLDKKLKDIEQELTYIEEKKVKLIEYKKDKREWLDKKGEYEDEKQDLEQKLKKEKVEYSLEKESLGKAYAEVNRSLELISKELGDIEFDLDKYKEFKKTEIYNEFKCYIGDGDVENNQTDRLYKLIDSIYRLNGESANRYNDLRESVNKFAGNFTDDNIFKFKTRFLSKEDYIEFANMLNEFVLEDKITELQKRVNERFAHIIQQISKETGDLNSKEGEIQKWIRKINKDFASKNFVTAIKHMEMRTVESSNKIVKILNDIKKYSEEYALELGEVNLFSTETREINNEKAVKLLSQLVREINLSKAKQISLSDSFGLEFRITENDNDTGWVEKLSNVGSEGTDILAKAIINIMLLNVFKNTASKKIKNFKLHCMMDEIGKLHPSNVEGILQFANERNILLINGSPTSYSAKNYSYIYMLSKDKNNITRAKRLIKREAMVLN